MNCPVIKTQICLRSGCEFFDSHSEICEIKQIKQLKPFLVRQFELLKDILEKLEKKIDEN